MDKFEGKPYQKLLIELDKSRSTKSNILIVSLPGLGLNHYLKSYLTQNSKHGVTFIADYETPLDKYNIIIWSRSWGDQSLSIFDKLLRSANLDQKFAIGVTRPWLLYSKEYINSYLSSHVYKTIYVEVLDAQDISSQLSSNKITLSPEKLNKIVGYTGGIPQLVKYFLVNQSSLDKAVDYLLLDPNLSKILDTIAQAVKKTSTEVLTKSGIIDDAGNFKSSLLDKILKDNYLLSNFDISIDFDLSLIENGVKNNVFVTSQEKNIIEKMLANNGNITKEEVSEIKWGEGKYDEFSDQAINKTIRRLSKKLKNYEIVTITKVGFVLKKNVK